MRGIKIDEIHTAADWGLILNSKSFPPPEPKIYAVEIEGQDGAIDLSESLTNDIRYKNRPVSFTFTDANGTYSERSNRLMDIVGFVHGRKRKIILDDDKHHYFYGRWTISDINQQGTYTSFALMGDCEPWRYAVSQVQRLLRVNNSEKNFLLYNEGLRLVNPTFKVEGNVSISFDEITMTGLQSGEYINTEILFRHGNNSVTVEGTGSVIVTYREAVL